MTPTVGPVTGGTVVEISGGAGYTDDSTVTICNQTVVAVASQRGQTLTFATPPCPTPGSTNVQTNNPSTSGLPAFLYIVPSALPGPEGLTGTVRTADGSAKPGAKVWLIHTYPEGILAETTTDADGHYLLAAPAGTYYEAVAMTQDPVSPTPDVVVYHQVQFLSLTLAAGGTTALDWVLPEMSVEGNCATARCRLVVSIGGFNPIEKVAIRLQSFCDPSGCPSPIELGTLTTDASGAAQDAFTIAKPSGGEYYLAAGPARPRNPVSVTYASLASILSKERRTQAGSDNWVRAEVNFDNLPTSGPYEVGATYETTTLAVQQWTRLDAKGHEETFFYVVYWNDRAVATGPGTLNWFSHFTGADLAEVDSFIIDRDLDSAVLDALVPAGWCVGPDCAPRRIHAVWQPTGPSVTSSFHLTAWYRLDANWNWIEVRPSEDADFRLTTSGWSERRPAVADVWVNGTLAPATTFFERSEMERSRGTGSWTCFTDNCPFR